MKIDRRPARPSAAFSYRAMAASACMAAAAMAAAPAAAAPAASAKPTQSAPAPDATFAKVGDVVLTHQDFDSAFAVAARNKFYHGKPPEGAVAELQREVGQNLVDDILLEREAKRRKIKPDQAAVQKTLDGYEQRYKDSAQWKNNRGRILPGLKAKLERDSVLEQLTRQVKDIPEPGEAELKQYYEKNKDKFTSPEQVHVQVILLKVDPSSPQAKWDGAREEGRALVQRLKGGADFTDLARLHSGDPSAERGGDMGYVHRGMLPEPAQEAIDKLKPGEFTPEPVVLLEGVAVFRLQERKPPVLNPLSAVRERAGDLLQRDKGDAAWAALLAKLRRETPVKFDESRFLPLAAKSADRAPAR